MNKKRKILLTICLSLLIVSFSIPSSIYYCFADYSEDYDYSFNISTIVDTYEESFYNSIYSSRVANPAFGDSLVVTQGGFTTNILYQYEYRVNNIISFTSSTGGISGIRVAFNDFVYDFNDSTYLFGSIYAPNALYVEPLVYAYDINTGYFSYIPSLGVLSSDAGWYAIDFNVPQNYVNADGYTYVMFLTLNIIYNTYVNSRTIEFDILPNYSYQLYDFFNSLENVERIEYELNFFESLAQSVDRFMLIEIFPGISFYSLLSVVIAVPIFIAVLKLWLGG